MKQGGSLDKNRRSPVLVRVLAVCPIWPSCLDRVWTKERRGLPPPECFISTRAPQ
jgi:hypothetical protein